MLARATALLSRLTCSLSSLSSYSLTASYAWLGGLATAKAWGCSLHALPVAGSCRPASPRVLRTHLHIYACRIYRRCVPCKYRASTIGAASPRNAAFYPLPERPSQRFAFGFLRIRSRPRHPCRSANGSPCRPLKDSRLQVSAPCRAHPWKNPALGRVPCSALQWRSGHPAISGSECRCAGCQLDLRRRATQATASKPPIISA